MADLVVGIGTSHGPLLNTPPEEWGQRERADRQNPALAWRGGTYTFDELVAARSAGFADECQADVWVRRHASCRLAIDTLGEVVRAHDLDALVVVSSDHKETYGDEFLAPFTVYWGDAVDHVPFTPEALDAMAPGLAIAEVANVPEEPTTIACHAGLARHLIEWTRVAGFDPAASRRLPAGRYSDHGIPHGWGFVIRQVLGGAASIPLVPLFVNTFWEPNPPRADRCAAFGAVLGEAVAAYPADIRVGLVASGGLSHLVIDEELDRRFVAALLEGDTDHLASIPDDLLVSGTSELRSWIVVAGAMGTTDRRARLVEYQPCYRSEAGTGCAMGFVAWDLEETS